MPDESGVSPTRRNVLRWLVRSFLSLWGVASVGVVVSFLRNPKLGSAVGRIVPAGSLSSLQVGEARLIRHGNRPIHILKVAEREVLALSATCTHRQCVLGWAPDREAFTCPCHLGVFDATGEVVSGLPRRPLERYRTSVRGDEVLIYLG